MHVPNFGMLTMNWEEGTVTAAIYDADTGKVAMNQVGNNAEVTINISTCEMVG